MLFPQPICCLYPDVCMALLLSVVRKNAVCVAFLRYTKQSPQSFYESITPGMSCCFVSLFSQTSVSYKKALGLLMGIAGCLIVLDYPFKLK